MVTSAVLPHLQRAQALLQAGQAGQAWMVVAPLRQAIDTDSVALRVYVSTAIAAGQIDEAVEALIRAAKLENNPPDLVGGLADLLGKAGRHDEALHYWDLLVGLRPDLADAHLNRAVAASKADKHALAIEAADLGLARFPGHARLLAVKAMAHKNAGEIDTAIASFERAVAAEPGRALTRHNQAVTLRAAGRYDEACEAFAEAARLGLAGAQFHSNWAAAALEAGQVGQAVELYEVALRNDSSHEQALKGLTRINIEYLRAEEPFAHYQRLVESRGGAVDAWIAWISELTSNYRFDEAVSVGHRALGQHAGEPALTAFLAFAEGMSGDARAALKRINALPDFILQAPATLIGRAQIALRAGDPELAAQYAEAFTQVDPVSQIAWSVLSLAWRLTGDPRENWLCDYDRLVMVTDVQSPDGAGSAAEYAARMAATLDPLHRSQAAPGNQSLREGTQTAGSLWDTSDPKLLEFREAIREAAKQMVAKLPNDPSHPFIGRKSARLDFSGSWSVRLRGAGGHHVPHFHSMGWMSSAYYARLPELDDTARSAGEGWIHFGKPPPMFGLDLEPRRIVEPKPGRLVLFPSYMWHGTLPFSSGDRLTAAFDFLPA